MKLGLLTAWILLSVAMGGFYGYALIAPASSMKTALLPGKTTHGHYQIEMDCNACHTPGMSVTQDACLKCHEDELRAARDTHAVSKFKDPTNAVLLETIDVTKCVTCHEEHVESRTHAMGVSIPEDYCAYCHQETLETRPSHRDLKFNSCATAGCHNFHDNLALYENFLQSHADDPEFAESPFVALLERGSATAELKLASSQADAPSEHKSAEITSVWSHSAHALEGVNCSACHQASVGSEQRVATVVANDSEWSDAVSDAVCGSCHKAELAGFGRGHHGMRSAQGLPPMTPRDARLPMDADVTGHELSCSSCHDAHSVDTQFAAVEACLKCHADEHSLAYKNSSHFALWEAEQDGTGELGSGVSCATCHMPRIEVDGEVRVQHNQNSNLRPNEKMVRDVCLQCHSLQASLDALADRKLIATCFEGSPSKQVASVQMAQAWFELKEREKQERKNKRNK